MHVKVVDKPTVCVMCMRVRHAGLMWATLTTNIAANIVAPANAFVNVNPQNITFNMGALITATIGAVRDTRKHTLSLYLSGS